MNDSATLIRSRGIASAAGVCGWAQRHPFYPLFRIPQTLEFLWARPHPGEICRVSLPAAEAELSPQFSLLVCVASLPTIERGKAAPRIFLLL